MIELVSLNASVHITSYLIYHVLHSMNNYKAKKKETHSLKRQRKHQNQTQIHNRFWNYQTGIFYVFLTLNL